MKTNKILQVTTVTLLMLVTGVFWGTWFSLSRSIENFTPEAFLAIGKTIIGNVAWPMRFLMPGTLLLMILVCWLHPQKRSMNFVGFLKAFVLLLIVLLITLMVLVPLDNQFKVWTVETMPADWETLRDKWQFYHTIRTFLSIGAFVSFAWAMVFRKPAV